MEKLYIIFEVRGQEIKRVDSYQLYSKSRNFVCAKFLFDKHWANVTRFASIANSETTYTVEIVNGECLVPWECLAEAGTFTVSVFGGDLITANKVTVTVLESGLAEGELPDEPTPGYFQQIVDAAEESANQAKGYKEFIEDYAEAFSVFEVYNPSKQYVEGNKVSHDGSSYYCIKDSLGNAPTNTTYWLLIAEKGEKGDTGAKGDTGDDGHTPVKGIDYWTEADKGEIADEVTERVPLVKSADMPLFVESIEECTDTSKLYVLPDGFIYAYRYTQQTIVSGENILSTLESYGDLTKGSNGLYFGYRQTSGSPYYTTAANTSMTGLIPITKEQCPFTLYIKGISSWGTSSNARVSLNSNLQSDARVQLIQKISDSVPDYFEVSKLDNDYYSITIKEAWFDAMTWEGSISRVALSFENTTSDQVIVVSYEPIEETVIYGYQWSNTGHAFVPTDYEEQIIDLENRTASLENRVDGLSAGADGTFTYVVNEAQRVAEIVQSKRTVGSLTFTAMSDFHVEVDTELTFGVKNNLTSCRDAGLGLSELQKYFKLDFTAMLGDYTYGDNTETIAQVKKDLTYVKNCMTDGMKGIPNIWVTGNHDINYGADTERRMTEDEMYAYVTGNNKGTVQDGDNIGRNYGYIDFENQKIRCIYLNTIDALDYPDNMDGTADDASEVTAIQAQWLVDVGLNLAGKTNPTDWGIVLFSHHCLSIFQPVTTILTAYKNGTSGSIDVTTNGVTTAVTYDFTSADRGEIICAIHGHNHNFIAKKISSEPYHEVTEANAWLWSVCVPNMDTTRENESATNSDTSWKNAFGEFDSEGNPVYYKKTQGTATSTSFCVITIDRKNRKIHAIAYGAGHDRVIEY